MGYCQKNLVGIYIFHMTVKCAVRYWPSYPHTKIRLIYKCMIICEDYLIQKFTCTNSWGIKNILG